MQRRVRVDVDILLTVMQFFLFPVWFTLRSAVDKISSGGEQGERSDKMGPIELVLRKMRERMGISPRRRLITVTMLMWGTLMYMVAVSLWIKLTDGFQQLHGLEPLLATLYYLWATFIFGVQLASHLAHVPGDDPFDAAYKKAEIALGRVALTRIKDGQRLTCSGMGLLNMVCRLPRPDEDLEEDEEEDEDDADDGDDDIFSVGKGTLRQMWMQRYLANPVIFEGTGFEFELPFGALFQMVGEDAKKKINLRRRLPWVDEEMLPDKAIFEFALVEGGVKTSNDWAEEAVVVERGMDTIIDTGRPTWMAEMLLVMLAAINASVGSIHRFILAEVEADVEAEMGAAEQLKESLHESLMDVTGLLTGNETGVKWTCIVITFTCSWVVFRTIFCIAFEWYTVLTFMTQISSVLSIDGSFVDKLPMYIDLRHPGNLVSNNAASNASVYVLTAASACRRAGIRPESTSTTTATSTYSGSRTKRLCSRRSSSAPPYPSAPCRRHSAPKAQAPPRWTGRTHRRSFRCST